MENTQISKEQINDIIKELWNKGYTPSQIGRGLKEKYNIRVKDVLNKKLVRYAIKELNLKQEIPEDLLYLFKKINRMLKHLELHKKDIVTKKKLEELENRVKSLIKYYKKNKKLPQTFEYSRDIAKMYGYS
ncbi:MAG: 30S ribosomal protein S15 [Candidatus Nanopusillus sp.]|nr:30S ribosomal protein S15 [Candidatus Nanopusillus sp.]